ncbi:MAG: serine protease [Geminicoccaceae bacterium]|nr:serine protease [Geminicoccaceae bacterium]
MLQPDLKTYGYDLEARLGSVLRLHSQIPPDAFTAAALGTEREGTGILIGDRGIVLTIGYLINEAEQIWLTTHTGLVVPGHALAYDFVTGFGIVQALGNLGCPVMPLGSSAMTGIGSELVIAAGVGIERAMRTRLIGKREFAGYWEYLLDEAFFVMPAHPAWGGAAVIGPEGDLVGIGSLLVQVGQDESSTEDSNMVVPIDLLTPILDDLVGRGRTVKPPRPWVGIYATEGETGVRANNIAPHGPAERAGIEQGDIIVAVDDVPVGDLADFYRQLWSRGDAGVLVELTILREGQRRRMKLETANREDLLRRPRLH